MAEKIRPELLSFLVPDTSPLHILVVEGANYLLQLRQMFPRAELYAVAAELDEPITQFPADVRWQMLDYLRIPLPYQRGYFDYIISDLALEQAENPQDIAAGFAMFLKETGAFLTSFRNIRHWSVLQNLMEGHYYNIVSRLYARPEFENVLYASFYKNVRVQMQLRTAPDGLLERLTAAGFENHNDDIETEFYLVCAERSMPELSLLKSMYTSSERTQMVRLMHRIEYDVDLPASIHTLWEMVDHLSVFPAFIAALAHETVVHRETFYRRLLEHSLGRSAYLHEMLDAAGRECADLAERDRYGILRRKYMKETAT